MSRRAAGIALVAYLAVVAAVTLGASPHAVFRWAARTASEVDGLQWVSVGDVDRAANVLLFAPLGLLLCYALPGAGRWLVWVICLAVTASIETAQLILPGRESTLVDVATNATGAAVGVLAHALLSWRTAGRTASVPLEHVELEAEQGGSARGEQPEPDGEALADHVDGMAFPMRAGDGHGSLSRRRGHGR